MMIIRISGGLGNQMFQYAFYKYLQKKGYQPLIDINDYKQIQYHNGFELGKVFSIAAEYADLNEVKKLAFFKQGLLCKIYRKIFKSELRKKTEVTSYDNSVNFSKGNFYLDGIWQDPTIVENVKDELMIDFQFRINNMSRECRDMAENITKCNSVSVHIRRGDYLNSAKFVDICDKKYYIDSINYIRKQHNDASFFVFSDDIQWCKENLEHLSNNITYVNFNRGKNSYLDMYLMTLCKHNIIANSTFSWWGAWLNANSNKLVICPKKWDASGRDLSFKKWIKL